MRRPFALCPACFEPRPLERRGGELLVMKHWGRTERRRRVYYCDRGCFHVSGTEPIHRAVRYSVMAMPDWCTGSGLFPVGPVVWKETSW